MLQPDVGSDIAVIGMAGRFPGATSPEELWSALCAGRDCISHQTPEQLLARGVAQTLLDGPNYVRSCAMVKDAEFFDAAFFGVTPREAELMDPQQRIFLECCWTSIENAGYDVSRINCPVGIFGGSRTNTYLLNLVSDTDLVESVGEFNLGIGNDLAFLTTRVSHQLNLTGPSCSIHTACSTSLVAVHLACQSLLINECDLALAGGVAVNVPHGVGYLYEPGGVLSPEGFCRVFDARARGTIFGSGAGVVVLKRYEDALRDEDVIHAVIKGSAVNNDGAGKSSFTAPAVQGQVRVIREALLNAGISPEAISYVECHGTGTLLGDAIEVRALTKAFVARGVAKNKWCAIGSVKTNVGHLDAAAGVTGLIKVILSLKHRQLPASLHFQDANPEIDFANSPFYVNTELREWQSRDGEPRRAGISAFGVGGTNVHVVVEEGPVREESGEGREWQLLVWSGKTTEAADAQRQQLAEYLREEKQVKLADIAYTLQVGRRRFGWQRAVVCRDSEEARAMLEAGLTDASNEGEGESGIGVAMVFPGQGAQRLGMGRELYRSERVFREQMDICAGILKQEMGRDIRWELYEKAAGEEVHETWFAQPVLFATEYALARLWESWGVKAERMLGHSLGEYVAACLSGVLKVEDALRLVVLRGRLMQEMPQGAMLAVEANEREVAGWLREGLWLGAVNGPGMCTMGGTAEEVRELEEKLKREGRGVQRLRTSHAFHSGMMEGMVARFVAEVRKIKIGNVGIPYISNVTGDWVKDEEVGSAEYWGRQLRETVQFGKGLEELLKDKELAVLEVGPGQQLKQIIRRQGSQRRVWSSLAGGQQSEMESMVKALGGLWTAGVDIDWKSFHAEQRRHRMPIPTYPFQRKRYWIDPPSKGKRSEEVSRSAGSCKKTLDVSRWFWQPSWKLVPRPSVVHRQHSGECWVLFPDKVGLTSELAVRLAEAGAKVVIVGSDRSRIVEPGADFTVNTDNVDDFRRILEELTAAGKRVTHLIHAEAMDPEPEGLSPISWESQSRSFVALLSLVREFLETEGSESCELWVLGSGILQVESGDSCEPTKASLGALCKILPQESDRIRTYLVDVVIPHTAEERRRLVSHLLSEISGSTDESVIAWRGVNRWVQFFERVTVEVPQGSRDLRAEGVYLITGGLGGVGMLLAEQLAENHKAKLVLTTRTPLPPRSDWENYLRPNNGGALAETIGKLLAIESKGGTVMVIRADVGDVQEMRGAVAACIERFGALHGVFHAAGITSGPSVFRLIRDTGRDECEVQARPKILGLCVLEEVLRDLEVDFVMSMSSNAAILGGLGFLAYAAANACIDSFSVAHSRRSDRVRWISVNWDHWPQQTRKYLGVRTSMDEFAMTVEEAKEAVHRVLMSFGGGQLIVSTGDLLARMDLWIRVAREGQSRQESLQSSLRNPRPKLKTDFVEPRNAVEREVARIWAESLGLEKIGINDDFFELGGHSLLGVKLIGQIQRSLGVEVPLRSLFESPSVAGLTENMGENLGRMSA